MQTTTGIQRRKCSVDGCEMQANRVKYVLCEKHYMRLRRNGSTDKKNTVIDGPLLHRDGYLLDHAPHHPLAKHSSGRIYQHRRVYYDAHGEGPFNCYHCGKLRTWDTLHIDHLDNDPTNNKISNLAASCPTCNQSRGYEKMVKACRERTSWMIEFNSERLHVKEWADRLGISRESMKTRIKHWPLNRAMTEPRRIWVRKSI